MQDIATEDEIEKFHTREVFSYDSGTPRRELILDETGKPIPLSICLCFAYEPSECCCDTTSWDNYMYDEYGY